MREEEGRGGRLRGYVAAAVVLVMAGIGVTFCVFRTVSVVGRVCGVGSLT